MISIGPFAQEWGSNDFVDDFYTAASLPAQQAAEWYWLHRTWSLDIDVTYTPTSDNFLSGTSIIEWNYCTTLGYPIPPTRKEHLVAGYQMQNLIPVGFSRTVQVEFFSAQLGGNPFNKSGVKYFADLTLAVRPLIQIFSADALNPQAVTTSNVQEGNVACTIDGVDVLVQAPLCTGHITMSPNTDWVYP